MKYLSFLFVFLISTIAFAWEPPVATGYVVDMAGKLTSNQVNALNSKIESYHREDGSQIGVLIIPSLQGQTVEDVAYKTFNTWKIGQEGKDNGVLLVLAIAERKSRIETGKGIGDKLTDLQSNDILRNVLAPQLKRGNFYGGIDSTLNSVHSLTKPETTSQVETVPVQTPVAAKPEVHKDDTFFIVLTISIVAFMAFFFYLIFRKKSRDSDYYSSSSTYSSYTPSYSPTTTYRSAPSTSNNNFVYVNTTTYSPPPAREYTEPSRSYVPSPPSSPPRRSTSSDSWSSGSSSSSDSGSWGGFDGGSSGGGGSSSDW